MRQLFWTTAELQQRGFSRTRISGMTDTGLLVPIRQGLWAEPAAPSDLVRVARIGGVATATLPTRPATHRFAARGASGGHRGQGFAG